MIKLKIYQGSLQSMKKDSKKSRKLQRERAERLAHKSAKGKASPDSKRGRRIHTCPHYTEYSVAAKPSVRIGGNRFRLLLCAAKPPVCYCA